MVDAVEVLQQVRRKGLHPADLELEPEQVGRQYLNNVFQRALALNTGLTTDGEIVIKATPTGALHVAAVASGFTGYTTAAGSAPDAWAATDQLEVVDGCNVWSLLIETNDAEIRFRNQYDSGWLDAIPLLPGLHEIQITSTIIQIQNRVSGSVATYHITGWV